MLIGRDPLHSSNRINKIIPSTIQKSVKQSLHVQAMFSKNSPLLRHAVLGRFQPIPPSIRLPDHAGAADRCWATSSGSSCFGRRRRFRWGVHSEADEALFQVEKLDFGWAKSSQFSVSQVRPDFLWHGGWLFWTNATGWTICISLHVVAAH